MGTVKNARIFILFFSAFAIIAFVFVTKIINNNANLEFMSKPNDAVEFTKTTLKVNESFGDDQNDWKIIYDEIKLRTEIDNIHKRSYSVKNGDVCRRSVPDLMIVGVGKSGTRELLDFMSIHPKIVSKKNPYQIDSEYFVGGNSYEKVKRQMPCKYSDQVNVLKADSFLTKETKPKELFNLNPNMKIIAIMREPIARLKSHLSYQPDALKSRPVVETTGHFIKFITDTNGSKKYNFMLNMSTYDVGLERYLKFFRRDQILVIESTEFMKNPIKILQKVENLLEIEHFDWNKYFVMNTEKTFYCIRKTEVVEKAMVCYESNRGRKHPIENIDAEHMERLREYFKPHNDNLFRLIGRRFDW